MTEVDLPLVEVWLRAPHVAKWWGDTTPEAEVHEFRRRITGEGDPKTVMLVVTEGDVPVGWCQWYRWDSYPEEAAAVGALPGEVGIDYAIGKRSAAGRGVGTEMIAALVSRVRRHHPGAGVLVDPDASNRASRRVLEHNGFSLVAVRPVASEPTDDPMAIYRLPGAPVDGGARLSQILLVDAANVVGSRPNGWWRDRPAATRQLLARLVDAIGDGRIDVPVVVVLEGAACAGGAEGESAGISVVHASGSGDDRLIDVAAGASAPVVVVSADRGLRQRVVAAGGTAVGPDWLHRRLGGGGCNRPA